jgi:hypothetical protein
VFSQIQYPRKSGKEKVTISINGKAIFNPIRILTNYDIIYAIDTNTKTIKENTISVSSILECYPTTHTENDQIKIKYRINGNMLFKNCPNNPEKYAWARLVAMITSSHDYSDNYTDHDVGRHHQYNSRQLPVYEDIYLPSNFELVYASSDTSNDSILNVFITKCDKNAGNILTQLENTGDAVINEVHFTLDMIQNTLPIADDPLLVQLKNISPLD